MPDLSDWCILCRSIINDNERGVPLVRFIFGVAPYYVTLLRLLPRVDSASDRRARQIKFAAAIDRQWHVGGVPGISATSMQRSLGNQAAFEDEGMCYFASHVSSPPIPVVAIPVSPASPSGQTQRLWRSAKEYG